MHSENIDEILRRALSEDIGSGDVTTEATIDPDARASGEFRVKAAGVISGTAIVARVFALLHQSTHIDWDVSDGDHVVPGAVLGRLSGNARAILTGERTALNILQRMSGIATATSNLVAAVKGSGTVILDTRKTAPGLRVLDKLAVRAGGGSNHRWGLDDMVLIKDNHIVSAGGIVQAITRARRMLTERQEPNLKIEVEARTLDEVREVIHHLEATGDPGRIMLDNMAHLTSEGRIDTTILREAIDIVGGRLETEASGNVTVETAPAIAAAGVDFISSGSLTHSVIALDISLDLMLSR
jgi:nicotinate-nucleotide pyrophosphorylase (carboxylating)